MKCLSLRKIIMRGQFNYISMDAVAVETNSERATRINVWRSAAIFRRYLLPLPRERPIKNG